MKKYRKRKQPIDLVITRECPGKAWATPKVYDALPEYVNSAKELGPRVTWAADFWFDKIYEEVETVSNPIYKPLVLKFKFDNNVDPNTFFYSNGTNTFQWNGTDWLQTGSSDTNCKIAINSSQEYKEGVKALAGIMGVVDKILHNKRVIALYGSGEAKWFEPGSVIGVYHPSDQRERVAFLIEGRKEQDLIGRTVQFGSSWVVSGDVHIIPGNYLAVTLPEVQISNLKFPEEKHKVYCQDQYEL